ALHEARGHTWPVPSILAKENLVEEALKEAGTTLQRLLDQILLRKDRRDQAMCVLGLREGRRVVLDQTTRIKTRFRRHPSELREGGRRRVLRVKHDSATEFPRADHRVSQKT